MHDCERCRQFKEFYGHDKCPYHCLLCDSILDLCEAHEPRSLKLLIDSADIDNQAIPVAMIGKTSGLD
jgi:hypothetical protein